MINADIRSQLQSKFNSSVSNEQLSGMHRLRDTQNVLASLRIKEDYSSADKENTSHHNRLLPLPELNVEMSICQPTPG